MTGAEVEVVEVGPLPDAPPGQVTVAMLAHAGTSMTRPEGRALAQLCVAFGLNPFLGHVEVIDTKQGRRAYITASGYRAIAEHTGTLAGITETETYEGETGYRVRVRVDRLDDGRVVPFEFAGGCGREESQAIAGKGLAMARTRAVRTALRWAFPLELHPLVAPYVAGAGGRLDDEVDDTADAIDAAGSGEPVAEPEPEPVVTIRPTSARTRQADAHRRFHLLPDADRADFAQRHGLADVARPFPVDALAELLDEGDP